MRVYLAGPMRGFPLLNFPAFIRAGLHLRGLGHEVFNPAEKDLAAGFDPAKDKPLPLSEYMKKDLPAVCGCDAIVVLPGWEKSVGADIEVYVARKLGKLVLRYPDLVEINAEGSDWLAWTKRRWEKFLGRLRGRAA